LILAEALLDAGQVQPIIISQASSLALFADTRVPVVNFPLLHRVPSAIAEDWYTEVLDALLMQLDPAVVIEDTYPDQRYARLPALADRPRLLVLRRLDGDSFDTIRTAGAFTRYDQVLIAQDEESFSREGHSRETLTAVASSGQFESVGPIFRSTTPAEIDAVRAEYAPDGLPLVVVNGVERVATRCLTGTATGSFTPASPSPLGSGRMALPCGLSWSPARTTRVDRWRSETT
jgi:hypothetical protein